VQPEDLTARARIREAALELFAADGVAGTSMRSIAARAGVSPSLVVHHYGSKARLREAVDHAVVDAFAEALASIDADGSPAAIADRLEGVVSGLIGGDRHVRGYLAAALFEAGPASQRLFDALMDLVEAGLDRLDAMGHLVPATDPTWRSYSAAFLILGPVLLDRQIEARLHIDPFAPEVVWARSASTMAVLTRGLFRDQR
jgi:AcrR family transcriptional regulator